jgi:hypothetical protein
MALQGSLAREQQKRAADRAGRIKAEQQLKQLHLQLAAAAASGSKGLQQQDQQAAAANVSSEGTGSSNGVSVAVAAKAPELSVFPFTAIGTLRSCFTSRWALQDGSRVDFDEQQKSSMVCIKQGCAVGPANSRHHILASWGNMYAIMVTAWYCSSSSKCRRA